METLRRKDCLIQRVGMGYGYVVLEIEIKIERLHRVTQGRYFEEQAGGLFC